MPAAGGSLPNPSFVRVHTDAQAATVTEIVNASFHDDPLWSWVFSDPELRPAQYRFFWRLMVDGARRFPWVWLAEPNQAAAVWLPPGAAELSDEVEDELESVLSDLMGPAAARVLDTAERFGEARPTQPHYYLSLLGTHPDHRGQGIGMKLLAATLREIDRENSAAYLESTNPANLERYRSLGFERCGQFRATDGPSVDQMWREPQGHPAQGAV